LNIRTEKKIKKIRQAKKLSFYVSASKEQQSQTTKKLKNVNEEEKEEQSFIKSLLNLDNMAHQKSLNS